MALTSEEMAYVFGTDILTRQVQLFIGAKGTVGLDEILRTFSDEKTSERKLKNILAHLVKRGVVRKDAGAYVTSVGKKLHGSGSDAAWKAARLLHTFTASDLVTNSDVSSETARSLCRFWEAGGHIVAIGKVGTGSKLYRMRSDSSVRPTVGQNPRGKRNG